MDHETRYWRIDITSWQYESSLTEDYCIIVYDIHTAVVRLLVRVTRFVDLLPFP